MRVLLVEDEARIADFIARGLAEQGYAVDVASEGDEALLWTDLAGFDLIILDVMLPRRDGMEVCRTLRERGVRTPVLMLTARDTVEDRVRGLDSGADDYLARIHRRRASGQCPEAARGCSCESGIMVLKQQNRPQNKEHPIDATTQPSRSHPNRV